jgi:anti-sigma regulatory factor (Ser/Thr protein kinase)
MIASDITAEYAETQKLSEDKAELSRLNLELKEYTQSIDDTVRRREILQAKVNIHDEMNRLMLSTVAAKCDDAAELDRIFTLWKQNALLLCMEADEIAVPKAAVRIEKLAEVLKIRLVRKNELPAELSEKQRTLFFAAAQEAIANAAKHARAKVMEISFESTDKYIACTFTNDGQIPTGEVRFTGGLGNLSLLAGKQNAQVFAEAGDTFSLTLKFMKNQPDG